MWMKESNTNVKVKILDKNYDIEREGNERNI